MADVLAATIAAAANTINNAGGNTLVGGNTVVDSPRAAPAAAPVAQEVAAIHRGIGNIFNGYIQKSINTMRPDIWQIIFDAVITSPAAASLTNGKLRIDFGLTTSPAGDIARSVADTLSIRAIMAPGGNLQGGLVLKLQPSDYSNLSGLGQQVTEKGQFLPWLDWLLTLGQQIIITNHGVSYGSKGRTGGGNMDKREAPFKVDSQFAGTVDDNFITRAVQSVVPQIQSILTQGFR
jgi:hypothetical protein